MSCPPETSRPRNAYTAAFRRQPAIYRAVIDDVIANIKPDFDEYGINEDVLAELQHVSSSGCSAARLPPFFPSMLTVFAEMGGQSDCVPCRGV